MLFIKKFIGFWLPMLFLLGGLVACNGGPVSLEEAISLQKGAEEGSDGSYSGDGILESIRDSEEAGVSEESGQTGLLYVYVCGAVKNPGVYTLPEGSRIVAALEAAGGFLPEAAEEAVNLAEIVSDGIQITIPSKEEEQIREEASAREALGLVNINTATIEELCTLSGIGEAKARAIIAYRQEIGSFGRIEQLKEVSGIGDSLFAQVKDSIYIE